MALKEGRTDFEGAVALTTAPLAAARGKEFAVDLAVSTEPLEVLLLADAVGVAEEESQDSSHAVDVAVRTVVHQVDRTRKKYT